MVVPAITGLLDEIRYRIEVVVDFFEYGIWDSHPENYAIGVLLIALVLLLLLRWLVIK